MVSMNDVSHTRSNPPLPSFISTHSYQPFSSAFHHRVRKVRCLPIKTSFSTSTQTSSPPLVSKPLSTPSQPSLSAAFPRRRPRSTPPALPPASFSPRPYQRPQTSTNNKKNTSSKINLGRFEFKISAHFILCLVPVLWASFVICAKCLYLLPIALPPAVFNSLRLIVSCLFFSPILISELNLLRRNSKVHFPHIIPGVQLGFLVFTANILQILGLKYAGAARSAFINQLSTIFVPLAAAALNIEPLTKRIASGAFIALTGIFLLTAPVQQQNPVSLNNNNSSSVSITKTNANNLNQKNKESSEKTNSASVLGDGLQFTSAAFTTAYVLRVSHFARQLPSARFVPLSAIKVCTQTGLSLVWLLGSNLWNQHYHHNQVLKTQPTTPPPQQSQLESSTQASNSAFKLGKISLTSMQVAIIMNGLLVLWAGVMVSALSAWLQTQGQAGASAGEAAVLFASQPVWTSIFAFLLLNERMQPTGMVGAALIVGGAVLASMGREERKQVVGQNDSEDTNLGREDQGGKLVRRR